MSKTNNTKSDREQAAKGETDQKLARKALKRLLKKVKAAAKREALATANYQVAYLVDNNVPASLLISAKKSAKKCEKAYRKMEKACKRLVIARTAFLTATAAHHGTKAVVDGTQEPAVANEAAAA